MKYKVGQVVRIGPAETYWQTKFLILAKLESVYLALLTIDTPLNGTYVIDDRMIEEVLIDV